MSNLIYLSNIRLSFPSLLKPEASVVGGVDKYSADLIMSPEHQGYAQFQQKVREMAVDKWTAKALPVLNLIQQDRKLRCFGNGMERVDPKTFEPYSGYDGNVYLSANCLERPQLIDEQGVPVPVDNTMLYMALARKMYGGCYVNAAIQPWLQDNTHGRGVRCELVAIQFLSDGEAFGMGTPDAAPLFGAVAAAPSVAVATQDWI